jgi:hypothetical protein
MNAKYVLTTVLKTRDAVAATAGYTLVHDLGYEGVLKGIIREDYWLVHLDLPENMDIDSLMVELAENTRIFVNPNKHHYSIHPDGSLQSTKNKDTQSFLVRLLVTNIDNRTGQHALATLKALYKTGEHVLAIHNGILWTLDIIADTLNDARKIAESMAITCSRTEGLLANPHCETVLVL